jgi:hypothetical protein
MSEPRREAAAKTLAAAEAPEALSPAAEIDPASERDKMIELGPTTSFGIRKVEASEPLGSFLRANPHLNRADRKQVGLSLRF